MATMTITLPDRTSEWIEKEVRAGKYSDAGAYLGELVDRQIDREMDAAWPEQPELTIEDLRRIVAESRASGPSGKTMEEIREEAFAIARARGWLND